MVSTRVKVPAISSAQTVYRPWRMSLLLLLLSFLRPLWMWALRRRLRRGKETQKSFAQKLMLDADQSQITEHPLVWGHAVGVGEVLALLGLFRRLAEQFPQHRFLLTSSSRTSGQALEKIGLPENFTHRYAPIDHPEVMERFLSRFSPVAGFWSETDLWPQMVFATYAKGIPMFMLNARVHTSKNIAHGYLAWFYRSNLSCFTQIYAQNRSSLSALSCMQGLALSPLHGNIKAIAAPPKLDSVELKKWEDALKNRVVWLWASSHAGEEEMALKAHQMLLQYFPEALLILVPRDIQRGAVIKEMAQLRSTTVLRSETLDSSIQADVRVFIADTLGELPLWYRLSPIAVIGGSFAPIGGHNPYEALQANCAILHGSHIHNFSESYAELMELELAKQVNDATGIATEVKEKWKQSAAKEQKPDRNLQRPSLQSQHEQLFLDIASHIKTSSHART